nr:unnamed protein product [Naegleria fowleri]
MSSSSSSSGFCPTFPQLSPHDKQSFGNNHLVATRHYYLDLSTDFKNKILIGYVDITCEALVEKPSELVLDARNLNIVQTKFLYKKHHKHHEESVNEQQQQEMEVSFQQFSKKEVSEKGYPAVFGQPLVINLGASERIDLKKGDLFVVRVFYETTQESEAIQWLNPEQTLGKKHPYLFTQCQAIHARSFLPCQDTPSNKITYSATIRTEKPLVAAMSAIKQWEDDTSHINIYHFQQNVPIPSYLIALVVGALESKQIGPRSTLYCEEEALEKAAEEFSQTEDFIKAAEEFLPPYAWGKYDLVVLPGSYPFGGMENSNLTFLTPTLLAGDKSLANVVAHEIAHSWSGNYTTNATWEEFWLNEGFTVFIERRILARLNGEEYAKFHAQIGYASLTASINHYKEINQTQFTKMIPKLDNIDPDDAFSSVPYEKGFNFLYYLADQIVGDISRFEKFLYHYFTLFAQKTVTSQQMKECFLDFFSDVEKTKEIDWDAWFYSEGDVIVKNNFENSLSVAANELCKRWVEAGEDASSFSKSDIAGWTSTQLSYFLDILLENEKPLNIQKLDEIYDLSKYTNSEIRNGWQLLALKHKYSPIKSQVVDFITSQGRMKFVRPLYRELFKFDKELAVSTFLEHKNFYHAVARKMIEKDLQLDRPNAAVKQ